MTWGEQRKFNQGKRLTRKIVKDDTRQARQRMNPDAQKPKSCGSLLLGCLMVALSFAAFAVWLIIGAG